jgi:hypothetical protein
MKKLFFFFLLIGHYILAQEVVTDALKTEQDIISEIEKLNKNKPLILDPRKAGWKSAILPGWGQYYNRKYWKIPIVWGAIGTGLGFVIWNNNQYARYKNAFNAQLNGLPHEFSDISGVDLLTALGNAQDRQKRQRDYAIAITLGVYLLNIIDAVVDAHLYEGRKDPDLVFSPVIINDFNSIEHTAKVGISLNYRF